MPVFVDIKLMMIFFQQKIFTTIDFVSTARLKVSSTDHFVKLTKL